MNLIILLITVALLLAAMPPLFKAVARNSRWRGGVVYLANAISAINITHKGRGTRLADAAFTSRYLVAKIGSDYKHIAICTAADIPLGVVDDMTPSTDTDTSYPLPIDLLGQCEDTKRLQASAAIAVGDMVVPAAAGQVKTLPVAGGGSTYILGRALTAAAAAGDLIEVSTCFPIPTTIPA